MTAEQLKVNNLTQLDYYYEKQEDTVKECLLALKSIILSVDKNIVHLRKFQIPYFKFKDYGIAFLWVVRKNIIVGFVEDKRIFSPEANRKQNGNVMITLKPTEDIPLEHIKKSIFELIEKYNAFKK